MGAREVSIEPATAADVDELAPRMRKADVEECLAFGFMSAHHALAESLLLSNEAWAYRVNGELLALFGVANGNPQTGTGSVWLLSGEGVEKCPVTFLRDSRWALGVLRSRWPNLSNHVDSRYSKAIAWLEWLGFEVGQPVLFFEGKSALQPFTMTRP